MIWDTAEGSFVTRYRWQLMTVLTAGWTIVTSLVFLRAVNLDKKHENGFFQMVSTEPYFYLHLIMLLVMAAIVAYIFVVRIKSIGSELALWIAILLKSVLLGLLVAFVYAAAVFLELLLLDNFNFARSAIIFQQQFLTTSWVFSELLLWTLILLMSQIMIEVNEKYSPGLFLALLSGKYKDPKSEERIVIFLDLRDSTPIAEKLGDQRYFTFIRDFINIVSVAFLDNSGSIYQYVGDEVVISWRLNEKNKRRCMRSVILARKMINRESDKFRRKFNIVPEFRIGIHIGAVTIGEIGVVKKDLAMSGDTMNTTARIRSACSELNEKILVSEAFINAFSLDPHQYQSKGGVELKGKKEQIPLYCINV